MHCPHCGSQNVHPISDTQTVTDTKGYGCCKGAVGYLILGPIGWLCGLCGMGKGKSVTTTRVYWVCGNCGTKFK